MMDIDEREDRAMALFREGYNCCQSVALAFSDVIASCNGMSTEQIAAVAGGFGGGFGRLREVCGCVSGMTFVAGALHPSSPAGDARKECYALVQEFAEAFRAENGAIVCRDLLGLRSGAKDAPQPAERTPAYYKARPCERLVGSAARIVAEKLREFQNLP